MLPEYRRFADSIYQYYKSWREIVDSIRESGEIDHVVNLFLVYLGFLISESISLTRAKLQGETLLNEEFIGTRLFLHSLSRYVRSKHIEELSKAKEKLVKEIERLKTDEDRHTRFYATLLLEHTLSTAMDKILPKLYAPITLILYKKTRTTYGARTPVIGSAVVPRLLRSVFVWGMALVLSGLICSCF